MYLVIAAYFKTLSGNYSSCNILLVCIDCQKDKMVYMQLYLSIHNISIPSKNI